MENLELKKAKSQANSTYAFEIVEVQIGFVDKVSNSLSKFTNNCKYKWLPTMTSTVDFTSFNRIQFFNETFSKSFDLCLINLTERLIYFTYRDKVFPVQVGTGIIESDAGWGCTLRVGQMAFANALFKVKNLSDIESSEEQVNQLRKTIIVLFLDFPISTKEFKYIYPDVLHLNTLILPPFSLQSICLAACQKNKKLGTRFKNSEVISSLLELSLATPYLEVETLYFPEGVITLSEIVEKTCVEDEEGRLTYGATNYKMIKPAVIFCAVVAGAKKIEKDNILNVFSLFDIPGMVGIMGGKEDAAYYFIGVYNNEELIYLDPHFTKQSLDGDLSIFKQDYTSYNEKEFFRVKPEKVSGFMTVCLTARNERELMNWSYLESSLIKFSLDTPKVVEDYFVDNEEDDF